MTQKAQGRQAQVLEMSEIAKVFQHIEHAWLKYTAQADRVRTEHIHHFIRTYMKGAYKRIEFVAGTTKETCDYKALEFDVTPYRSKALDGLAVEVVTLLTLMELAVNTNDRKWFYALSLRYQVALHGCYTCVRDNIK